MGSYEFGLISNIAGINVSTMTVLERYRCEKNTEVCEQKD